MLTPSPRLTTLEAFGPLLALCDSVLLTSAELAKHWRYTEQHIHAMRRFRKGPAFIRLPTGGGVRYRLSEVMAWEIHGHDGPVTPERLALAAATLPALPPEQKAAITAHLCAVLFPPKRGE